LLLVRVGVAVGESGCTPSANSLIADYFSRGERPRALSIYMLGASLGLLIGFLAAGWLNQVYGWRVTFMALGLPGLVPAMLAWLTLREPRHASRAVPAPMVQAPFLQVCRNLWRNRTFRHLLYCFSVGSFFNSGMGQWEVAFFIRSFGLKTGALGAWFSVIYGLGSAFGLYCGGHLASRYAAHNERLQLKAMALAYCVFSLTMALRYLSPNLHLAFVFLAIGTVGGATISGPLFAMIHTLVPERMRATAIAIIYLCANLIGGLGPLAVGATSDALHTLLGQESLRYAMLILTPGYLWCAWHLWLGSKTIAADLAAVHVAREGDERNSDDAVCAKSG
ncbi:MAG TPA: MFS transporter, partial [Bradyrhizobium sp.]|nr:MFS transporter [Bradyrhizobium sp.]